MNQLLPGLSIKKTAVVALSLALTIGWIPAYAINKDDKHCDKYGFIKRDGKRQDVVNSCAAINFLGSRAHDTCLTSYQQSVSDTCRKGSMTKYLNLNLFKRCSWKDNKCKAIDGLYRFDGS
jgi:hypothetical protein